MIRYVYYIFDHNTAEFYIGSRTWQGGDAPKKDSYMGSSYYWNDDAPDCAEKRILKKGFETEEEKYKYEKKIIDQHFSHPKNVNKCNPAEGFYFDWTGKHRTAETRKKISESLKGKTLTEEHKRKMSESAPKGKNHPLYGKHLTAETRRKLSEAHKGKVLTEEHKRKLSKAFKGENNPFYGKTHTAETKKKMSESTKKKYGEKNPFYGKTHTAEARRKLSEAHKGKTLTEEHKRKISKAVPKGKNNSSAKAVLHLVTGKTYDTAAQASKSTGENYATISDHCRGKVNNPRWTFANEAVSKKGYWLEEGVEHIESGKKFLTQKEATEAFNCGPTKVGKHCNNKVKKPKFKYYKEKIYWNN